MKSCSGHGKLCGERTRCVLSPSIQITHSGSPRARATPSAGSAAACPPEPPRRNEIEIRDKCLGFRVWGLRIRVEGVRFRVENAGLMG